MTDINYEEFKELFEQLSDIVFSVDFTEVKHNKIFYSGLSDSLIEVGLLSHTIKASSNLDEIVDLYNVCQKKMAYLAEMY